MNAPHTILVVENETVLLDMFAEALSLSYRVLEATSVDQAVDLLRCDAVDGVLTDLNLGEKSGLDLMRWIRDEQPALLPNCLVMSGNMFADLDGLAVPLITKPVDLWYLLDTFEKLFFVTALQ